MLTPKRKKAKHSSKHSIIMALTVLLLLLIFAWLQEKYSFSIFAKEESNVSYNVEQLWNWSNQLQVDNEAIKNFNNQWSIRWDAKLPSGGMEQLAAHIFTDEKGNPIPKAISQQGKYIEGNVHGGKITLHKTDSQLEEQKVVILFVLNSSQVTKKQLQTYIEVLHKEINELDKVASMSIKVSGTLSDKVKPDDLFVIISPLTIVDEYKDNSMKVLTMYTPLIKESLTISNQKNANLQYAVYEDERYENYVFTMGIPLISGEFGETTSYQYND